MSAPKNPSLKDPSVLFLSVCGIGFIPRAPGTFGSLAALPLLYILGKFGTPGFFIIPFLLLVTIGASFITEYTQKQYNIHDPGWIVIDEATLHPR